MADWKPCLLQGLMQDCINPNKPQDTAFEKDKAYLTFHLKAFCAFLSHFRRDMIACISDAHLLWPHAHAAPHRKQQFAVLHSLYSTSNVHNAELAFTYSMAYFSVHSFAILLYLIEHGVLEKKRSVHCYYNCMPFVDL